MTTGQLKSKYIEVFGEPTNSKNKQFLIKRIAWRMQANSEGGLSERALKRAREIARDSDLHVRAPNGSDIQKIEKASNDLKNIAPNRNHLIPGIILTRKYKGKMIIVKVCPKGFEYDGENYRSLSAIAEAVTGTHWNGNVFFKSAIQGTGGNNEIKIK